MLDHALDMFDLRTPRLSPNRDVAPWLLPTPFKLQLDNLPWFIFQVLYSTFLKTQESMGPYLNKNTSSLSNISIVDSCERITDYDLSLDHPTNSSDVRRGVFIMEGLQLRPSMPEERRNLRYLLGLPGEHHRTDLGVFDESGFGPIIDVLSTSWTSDSPALNMEENIHTLHSYFRPFILEKHDGELLEGTARILGPPYDGLLQFLNYTINLLSNNLLSETDVDKIVRWIDEIQGYELFAKLLSTKSSTIEALASNLLPSALRLKNARFTRILLDARVDPNSPMGYHRIAPLQYITKHGDIELVRMLLDAGADVNAPPTGSDGQDGDTALQAAAKNGSVELIEILLDAGADINAPPPQEWGRTALQAAAMNGNIELVQILLDASADINAPPAEEWGYTVLQAAAKTGNIELVQILLDAGADINAPTSQERGRTALQAAAEKGNIELVEILLNAGADVNAPPSPIRGHTALQAAVAAEKGNIDLVEILLNAGADINDPPLSGYRKRTALQAAAGNGNIELVHVLLSAGTDINAPPSESSGRTALQAAAEKGNIELVQILLDAGADINAPTSQERGRTALQAAAEKGNIELVEILLNAGAEVNAPPSQEYGVTAIQAAVIRGHIRIAQLLLNAGADVNAAPAGNEGRTALEGAAEHGRIDLLQLLINAGADTNSSQCTRALKLAATNGYDAVCGLLNRFRNGDRISPPEVRQIKECEDQLSLWDEVHDSNYQPSEGSLPDEDTEDERDSLVEYGIGSSSDDVMKFSGEDGMAAEPFALYWCRYATD
jgi:ankyrin repeat protein